MLAWLRTQHAAFDSALQQECIGLCPHLLPILLQWLHHRQAPSGEHSGVGLCVAGSCRSAPLQNASACVHMCCPSYFGGMRLRCRHPPSQENSGLGITAAGSIRLSPAARWVCSGELFAVPAALPRISSCSTGHAGMPSRSPQAAEQVPGLAPPPAASSHAAAGAAGSSPGSGDLVNIDRLPPRPVGRIAVHCLGGAAWQLSQQDGPHAEREVYRTMLTLKQAVRRSRCAAMVTVLRGGLLSQEGFQIYGPDTRLLLLMGLP